MIKPPDCFRPNKDLSQKVEELKNKPKTPKKNTRKKVLDVLAEGINEPKNSREFFEKLKSVKSDAFKKIIKDTYEGKIEWIDDPYNVFNTEKQYTAKATVLNAEGYKVTIPVLFQVYYFYDISEKTLGFLHLGDVKENICLNTTDEDVKMLSIKYFKTEMNEV